MCLKQEDEPFLSLAGTVEDERSQPPLFPEAGDNAAGGENRPAPEAAPAGLPVASEAAVSANLSVKIVADESTNSLLIRSTARDYRQLADDHQPAGRGAAASHGQRRDRPDHAQR